jgi:signal-transduction protein with cAMP-binding, CBS, and nucleotidyltransferase domain
MITKPDIRIIPLKELPDLTDKTTIHVFKPGQIIYYEGHMPYGLFILLEGKIEILNNGSSDKLETGAVLGVNSFLNSQGYSATAKAITECKVSFLSKAGFSDIKEKNNQAFTWLYQ